MDDCVMGNTEKSLNDDSEAGQIDNDDIVDDDQEVIEDDDIAIVRRICQDSMTYDIDYNPSTGRIIGLSLQKTLSPSAPYDDHHWDLPPDIARLEELESLSLTSCKLLPPEISILQKLKKLTLIGCKRLEEFPPNIFRSNNSRNNSMWQLEELRIVGIIPMIPPYILSQVAPLTQLKVFQFSFHGDDDEEGLRYLNELSQPTIQFRSSLRELMLNRCHITTNGFNFLLTQVIPCYPNLKSLSICKNQIQSFRGVVAPMGNEDFHNIRCQLQEVILSDNPIWSLNSSDAEPERHFLEHFLQHQAVRVQYLGYRFDKSTLWSPTIQHLLDINKSGRFLINQGTTSGSIHDRRDDYTSRLPAQTDNDDSTIDIPLGLWAVILERLNRILPKVEPIVREDGTITASTRTANAIYYLVRNGPALAERNFTLELEARNVAPMQLGA